MLSSKLLTTVDGGISTFAFDMSLITFVAAMAKRNAGGPFAGGIVVQGDPNNSDALTDDIISISRGAQINGNFYTNFDGNQGSVVLWWTPEHSYNALDGAGDHYLWYVSANYYLRYEYDNNSFNLTIGGQSLTVASDVVAGTTYPLIARWDCHNTLDGTNYLCLSIGDSHTFGVTAQPTAAAPDATLYLGNNGGSGAAGGSIEGLTIYRRPLFDGTYGINTGYGDEIDAIDPNLDACTVTGSWDVVLCVPTNAAVGSLVTGAGEAWSHPYASNVLTDWDCVIDFGASGWSTKGAPSSGPEAASAAGKIFAGGYTWTCAADGDGLQQSKTGLTVGRNYVMRCVAHGSDANSLRVRVTDDTNGADITAHEFGSSSSRAAPGIGLISWELPTVARHGVAADCTAMTISIEGTANGQEVVLHQFEVLQNLLDNPSFEVGSSNPFIPTGWNNDFNFVVAGQGIRDTSDYHSGGSSFRLETNTAHISTPSGLGLAAGTFACAGGWGKRTDSGLISVGAAAAALGKVQAQDNSGLNQAAVWTTSSWTHKSGILRVLSTGMQIYIYPAPFGTPPVRWLDDVYTFALTPVTLTTTAATEDNSTESAGLRIDGRDTASQTISNLAATSGRIRFGYTPRHSAADVAKFGNATSYIVELYGDSNNYIRVYWSAANTITLAFNDGGGEHTQTWDATGAIMAGTTYQMQIDYNASQMTLSVDGMVKATITTSLSFATIPITAYWGSSQAGASQADALFAAPV